MAIRFKCKCGTELNVADGMAGKQGKCPKCKNVLTVPTGTRTGVSRKRAEDEEVAEAAVVEDDEVLEADAIEEEDERPRKRKVAARDEDDEDDRPRKKSRRDDDEDEEERPRKKRRRDDDDDDDRPRKKKRARDEDDEEEDDEDDDRSSKRKARDRRAGWERASKGVFLHAIGQLLFAGAVLLISLVALLFLLASAFKSMGFFTFANDIGKIFVYLSLLLMLASQILSVVGFSFTVTTPGKHGEMGLGIATLSVVAVSLLGFVYLLVKFFEKGMEGFAAIALGQIMTNPFAGIEGGFRTGSGMGFIIYLMPVLVAGWMSTSNWYLFSAGKTLKDRDISGTGFLLGIALPSTLVGLGLLVYLMELALKKSQSPVGMFVVVTLQLLTITAMVSWDGISKWNSRHSLNP